MSKNYSIAMVDFRLTWHHPYYLGTFASKFHQLGCTVDLFTINKEECRDKLINAVPSIPIEHFEIHEIKSAKMNKRVLGCRSYFRLMMLDRELATIERTKKKKYDLVFFPYIDDLVQCDLTIPYMLKAPFPRYFSGLLMEPRLKLLKKARFPVNFITSTWLEYSSTNYRKLGVLVEDVTNEVQTLLGKSVTHYPDFCSSDTEEQPDDPICKVIRDRKNGRFVTSLLGSILPHKSLDLFLSCINQANPDDHLFVIAGRIAKEKFTSKNLETLNDLVETERENVLIFDQWIPSEAVFDTIVTYSDILYAHYRNFPKSSNILSKAAYHKKPVIVSDKYLLGERVKKYNLGFSLPESKIPDLYNTRELKSWSVDSESREIFIKLHSESRLQTIFRDLIA